MWSEEGGDRSYLDVSGSDVLVVAEAFVAAPLGSGGFSGLSM